MQSARAGDMATKASEEKKVIYLSINQGEQAKHQSAEYLLAAPVFEEIARLLDESLSNLRKARADDCRGLICPDTSIGGKSTI